MDMMACLIAVAGIDICGIAILLASYAEKRSGRKYWSKISADMEIAEGERAYALECDEVLIGRHASADIRIQDMSVSRYHAMLNVTDGKWTITDLGSKSGVYINGVKTEKGRLRDGDLILLGTRRLIFRKRRARK